MNTDINFENCHIVRNWIWGRDTFYYACYQKEWIVNDARWLLLMVAVIVSTCTGSTKFTWSSLIRRTIVHGTQLYSPSTSKRKLGSLKLRYLNSSFSIGHHTWATKIKLEINYAPSGCNFLLDTALGLQSIATYWERLWLTQCPPDPSTNGSA